LTPAYVGLLEFRGSGLTRPFTFILNLRSVAKMSYAACLGLFPAVSEQFTLEMSVAA